MAVKQLPAAQASTSFIPSRSARDPPGSYDANAPALPRSNAPSYSGFPIAVIVSTMPARHRVRYASAPQNCPPSRRNSVQVALESVSTLTWNPCPRSAGIRTTVARFGSGWKRCRSVAPRLPIAPALDRRSRARCARCRRVPVTGPLLRLSRLGRN
jgi:hypothetical protein